ncbi:unnamed protein product [Moneuplotes crassus]|uniref:Uncharacterized protein n=1 Tax=Euplotes crassus TaxID=5936 RepID=A0AAD1X8R6_EUPCR|nr:unnamed protein product [Moneuplotes crassus]
MSRKGPRCPNKDKKPRQRVKLHRNEDNFGMKLFYLGNNPTHKNLFKRRKESKKALRKQKESLNRSQELWMSNVIASSEDPYQSTFDNSPSKKSRLEKHWVPCLYRPQTVGSLRKSYSKILRMNSLEKAKYFALGQNLSTVIEKEHIKDKSQQEFKGHIKGKFKKKLKNLARMSPKKASMKDSSSLIQNPKAGPKPTNTKASRPTIKPKNPPKNPPKDPKQRSYSSALSFIKFQRRIPRVLKKQMDRSLENCGQEDIKSRKSVFRDWMRQERRGNCGLLEYNTTNHGLKEPTGSSVDYITSNDGIQPILTRSTDLQKQKKLSVKFAVDESRFENNFLKDNQRRENGTL